MADVYVALTYPEYKALEEAMDSPEREKLHGEGEYYHRSIRLPIGNGTFIEFHGPVVKAAKRGAAE